jgi:signal transduction histidine kinase
MAGFRQQLLPALFFLIVFVPAVILSVFAARAVNQEEMVQRRRMEDTLLLELDQTNTILRFTLQQIISDLHGSMPDNPASDPSGLLGTWKKDNRLVGIPYSLDPDGTIGFPDITEDESDQNNLFYWRYLNFFSNKESIPIYRNIAREYEEEILDQAGGPEDSELSVMEQLKSAEPSMARDEAAEPALNEKQAAPAQRSKAAEGLFESSSLVQERVYQMAQTEGQQALQRNVLPQLIPGSSRSGSRDELLADTAAKPQTVVRSVYIESTRYFEEIIRDQEYGIIPRIFDNAFILLYWERRQGSIAGCELNMGEVNRLLVEAIFTPGNTVRYLNILDQGGRPLIDIEGLTIEQWRRPLVAKEISELLPYWETAILLQSPEDFEARIESSRYFLSFLILFLSILLFIGLFAIYQISAMRLRSVQQRVGFVTNVSHELKTPLTSIRMYSEMLAQGYQTDPAKIEKYSSYIASESRRLTRLINNVLDFSRLEKNGRPLHLGPCDINTIIRELYESFREEYIKSGFTFALELSPDALFVMCDREAVFQVLLNLISNARKYSKETREITIHSSAQQDGSVEVRVADRGIGIPGKYRKKIFKEFFRIDTRITSDSGGTGLGLAIARKIMLQHKGSISFSPLSIENEKAGSIFILRFPAIRPEQRKGDTA